MPNVTINIDVTELAKAIAAELSGNTTPAEKPSKAKGGKTKKAASITAEDVAALCKELGASVCRPVLKEAGYKSPKALGDADEDELQEIFEQLQALQNDDEEEEDEDEEEDDEDEDEESEEDEEDDEEDDEEEIDVETVKKAVQAFAKENGKDEADEILEEFGIKSVRTLKKLSQEQLEELYEAVTE